MFFSEIYQPGVADFDPSGKFGYEAILRIFENTSRRFIIRFIHDKDGHKLISFADYFKTRAYAEEI